MADTDHTYPAIARYFAHGHRRSHPEGSTIITAGDHSSALYYIESGSVSVMYEDDDGHEILLAYLNQGDFFGEIGMFDEKHERSAWVRARTDCEIAQMSYERLREFTAQSPEILYAMLCQLSLRVRDTTRKVGELAFMDVAGRVARALLDLCQQPDAQIRPEGVAIDVTRQELGRIVGCSREMASRVLRDLEDQSVIEVSGKTVLVYRA